MKSLAVHLGLLTALLSFPRIAPAQEIRAFWADAFAEGIHTPEQVDTLLRRLRAANCNAVFIQVRKGGDAYYLSRYEPWAADNPQRFDGLAYLIEKAHTATPRIQVHAWINTFAVGKTHGNPSHIAAAHPEWLSVSDTGENYDGEATKIDPGNPDAADWTFRVYLDVARHYDVDGIHFDFVRYGSTDGKGRFGYNPVSVARFNARYGRTGQPAWDDPLWKQWRRDQVTALVRKVYAMATAVKPELTVSAATITWGDGPHDMASWKEKSAGMNRVFQDWRGWMEEGILDINCQMSYYREAKHGDYFRHWIDWGKDHQYRRWVVPSSGIWLNPISDSLKQIEAIRKPSKMGKKGRGVLLYSYAGTNVGPDGEEQQYNEAFYTALSQPSPFTKKPPFAKPATFPRLPWKEKPKTGIVKGFVLTAETMAPVDGARVTLTGKVKRTQRTDGTGFYAFVDVPPGNYGEYDVKVEARGYAPKTISTWEPHIHAPSPTRTRTVNFFLGGSPARLYSMARPSYILDTQPIGTPVCFQELRVVGGTDTFPGILFVGDLYDVAVRVRLAKPPILPIQSGDLVALSGRTAIDDGERIIDQAVARLVDIRPRAELVLPLSRDESGVVGSLMRAVGAVKEGRSDRFVLESGRLTEVMLAGRKEPAVESPASPLTAPPVGSRVQVTGIVTITKQPDGKSLIRIRLRNQEDILVLSSGLSERLKTAALWSALPLAGILVWLIYTRARPFGRDDGRRTEDGNSRA